MSIQEPVISVLRRNVLKSLGALLGIAPIVGAVGKSDGSSVGNLAGSSDSVLNQSPAPVMRCQCDPKPGKLVSSSEIVQRAHALLSKELEGLKFTYDNKYYGTSGDHYKGRSLKIFGVDVNISDYDLLFSIDKLSNLYLAPAMITLADGLKGMRRPLIFHSLELPGGLEWSKSVYGNFSLRLVRSYDIRSNTKFTRFDVLFSFADETPIENPERDAYYRGVRRDEWLRADKRKKEIEEYENSRVT